MGRLMLVLIAVCVSSAISDEPLVTVLDNGLTVITQELHYAPVVASVITYGAGSRNESGANLGISHFCEHMMFKGTPDMPYGRFWQIVQRDGGYSNAMEGKDVTYYYLMLPSSRVEDALMIESDRMVNCLMDSAEVVSEINVVHEERRMNNIDSADGALQEALWGMAYKEHPYGKPVLGYDENILGYDHNMVRDFYDRYYCPSNAVLSLVGDFNTAELLPMVEYYFGDIAAGSVPDEEIAPEPVQTEPGFVQIEHASNLPRFAMSFHSPSGFHPVNPVMTLIAVHLSNGRSARLRELLIDTELAHGVWSWNESNMDSGLFTIYVTMNPPEDGGATIDDITSIIWNELEDITDNGIPVETLNGLRNRYRAAEILGNSNPLGLALNYSLSYAKFNDPLFKQKQMAQIEHLTNSDIREAASTYFERDLVNIAVLVPSEIGGAGGIAGQDLPTGVAEPSSMNFEGLEIPDEFLTPPVASVAEGVVEYQFDNGLQLLVREDHTFPVVSLCVSVPLGTNMHPDELSGLATVTSETMMQGTMELEYADFHNRLEIEGAYLRFFTSWNNSVAMSTMLSEDIETGFVTAADLLLRPAFRESDFDRVMNGQYSRLAQSAENIFNTAYESLRVISAESPDYSPNVTAETLERITHADAVNFYNLCCRPEGSVITVVGDVNPEEVLLLTERYFGEWTNPQEPLPQITLPRFSQLPGDTVVTYMAGRTQAAILVSRPSPGADHPEYPAFSTMNKILGGGLGSRLGHSIRDEQGLAYGVGSWEIEMGSSGYFIAYLTTLADYAPQALVSVLNELNKISTENVLDIELRLAQANIAGEQALSAMTYSDLAYTLTALQARGKPLDWHQTYLKSVLELTPCDIRSAAEEHLVSNEWFISIAGTLTEEDMFAE